VRRCHARTRARPLALAARTACPRRRRAPGQRATRPGLGPHQQCGRWRARVTTGRRFFLLAAPPVERSWPGLPVVRSSQRLLRRVRCGIGANTTEQPGQICPPSRDAWHKGIQPAADDYGFNALPGGMASSHAMARALQIRRSRPIPKETEGARVNCQRMRRRARARWPCERHSHCRPSSTPPLANAVAAESLYEDFRKSHDSCCGVVLCDVRLRE
jgi:hypothetical protein